MRAEALAAGGADAAPSTAFPYVSYSAATKKELAIFNAAAEIQRRYGTEALPTYIVSTATSVSDILEAVLLLKEAGLMHPGPRPRLAMNVVPFSKPSPTSATAATYG